MARNRNYTPEEKAKLDASNAYIDSLFKPAPDSVYAKPETSIVSRAIRMIRPR